MQILGCGNIIIWSFQERNKLKCKEKTSTEADAFDELITFCIIYLTPPMLYHSPHLLNE